jgi:hypothetical protein
MLNKKLTPTELEELVKKIYLGEKDLGGITKSPNWGRSPMYFLSNQVPIYKLIEKLKCKNILDYGCGYSTVIDNLQSQFSNIEYAKYDPFIEEYNNYPVGKYDLVMCNVVLHLLDQSTLDHTIKELYRLSNSHVFVSVASFDNQIENIKSMWENRFNPTFVVLYKGVIDVPIERQSNNCSKHITFLLKKI